MLLLRKIKIYLRLKNSFLHFQTSYLVIETNVPTRGKVYSCLYKQFFPILDTYIRTNEKTAGCNHGMGLLIFLLQETGFKVMQNDLPTSEDAC